MRQKSLICLCSLITLCCFSSCEGRQVIETSDFAQAFTYLEEDTFFVVDLDNTLVEAAQHLGSEQWFSHHFEHFVKNEGLDQDEALARIVPLWIEVQNRSDMRLIDPSAPSLLNKMKTKNVPMIGLTKRDPKVSSRTLEQISPLDIDFSATAQIKGDFLFEDLKGTLLRNGILFVGQGIDKGPALVAYLKKLKEMPRQIVAIDDKLAHLESIAAAVEPLGIIFVGIRYSGADERVKSYNPRIADLQWEHFYRILSDEQALHLLKLDTTPL
jgi:hypothetical protein